MTKLYNGKTVERLEQVYLEAFDLSNYGNRRLAGIQAVAEACSPRWISVEERLPEGGIPVLTIKPAEIDPTIGWIDDDSGEWVCDACDLEVSHWMPLPQPPQQGDV